MGPDRESDIRFLLGRIDGTLTELKALGEVRDRRVADLSRQLDTNKHDQTAGIAGLSRSIDALGFGYRRIESSLGELGEKVGALDGRVERLEAPVKRARRLREERRRAMGRIITMAVGAASFSWLFLGPVYQTLAESVMRRWLGD